MHHGPDITRVCPETVQGIGVVGVMIRIGSLSPTVAQPGFQPSNFHHVTEAALGPPHFQTPARFQAADVTKG